MCLKPCLHRFRYTYAVLFAFGGDFWITDSVGNICGVCTICVGNELVSGTVELTGAESTTTLPFVICSFIFFSNAVLAMLDVAVLTGADGSFAISPLRPFVHVRWCLLTQRQWIKNRIKYACSSIHTIKMWSQTLFAISFFIQPSMCSAPCTTTACDCFL